MRVFDAAGSKLSDAQFAEAYRAVIPNLSDPKFVTVRMHPNRASELGQVAGDVSEVIEVATVEEKDAQGARKFTERVVAVPISIHPKDGATLVRDTGFDPSVVSFEVNGIPVVQITNLALSAQEQAAAAKAAKDAKAAADKAAADSLEAAKAQAFKDGQTQALLDQARAAGAASAVQTPAPTKQ